MYCCSFYLASVDTVVSTKSIFSTGKCNNCIRNGLYSEETILYAYFGINKSRYFNCSWNLLVIFENNYRNIMNDKLE